MLTMAVDQRTARRVLQALARQSPAQYRMVEMLADGQTVAGIAARFNGCGEKVIARQLAEARRACGVACSRDLVDLYLAAQ